MTTGQYFALSLPMVTLLLALGFAACWYWQPRMSQRPRQHDWAWMAGCLALFSLGLSGQIAHIPRDYAHSAVVSALCYHLSVWCLAEAMCARFGVRVDWLGGLLAGGMALALLVYYAYVNYQLYVRIYVLNFGLGAQLGLCCWRLLHSWSSYPGKLERAVLGIFGLFVLSFFVRTVLTTPSTRSMDEWKIGGSAFWIVLQLSLLVFALLFVMLYVAMAVQSMVNRLQDERNQDPLTELLNRRAFWEALEHGPRQTQQPLGCLLVCDVDYFKQVNDRWGHGVGDAALQALARILKDSVRKGDLVARFGGEEFVLLLYGLTPAGAQAVGERIRQRLQKLRFADLPSSFRITVSMGLVPVQEPAALASSLQRADALLYQAKQQGRNRICSEPLAELAA